MIRSLITIFLLSAFTFSSCTGPGRNSEDDSEIQTITIHEFRDYLTDEKFTDLATDIYYQTLETNDDCLLTWNLRIQEYGGIYYIKSGQEIFLFNRDGLYQGKLSKVGNGPGEYTKIRSFFINGPGNELWIISENEKILVYDLKGEFLNYFQAKDSIPTSKWNLHVTDDQVLFDGYYTREYTAMRYDKQGQLIEPLSQRFIVSGLSRKSYYSKGDNPLYKTDFCDTIYRVLPSDFVPFLRFDFGDNVLTWNDRVKMSKSMHRASSVNHRYYNIGIQGFAGKYMISFLTVLNDRVLSTEETRERLGHNPETHYLLYNLKSEEKKIVPYFGFNDEIGLYLRGGIVPLSDGKIFCTICLASNLHEQHQKILDEHGEVFLNEKYPRLVELCMKTEPEDNPLIITFKLRF